MNNQTPPPNRNNRRVRGEPLDPDDLRAFADIDAADIESAAAWWNTHATDDWRGALDTEPIDDE